MNELGIELLQDIILESKHYGMVTIKGKSLLKVELPEIIIKEMDEEQVHLLVKEYGIQKYGLDIDNPEQMSCGIDNLNKMMGVPWYSRFIKRLRRRRNG
jgi:hypothetical protein